MIHEGKIHNTCMKIGTKRYAYMTLNNHQAGNHYIQSFCQINNY